MEIIRRTVRKIIGYNSSLYQSASGFVNFTSTTLKQGIKTWGLLNEIQKGEKGGGPARAISLKNLDHPISLRPGTDDVGTIISNVIREEYGRYKPKQDPEWMIDAGAYIGDTTAYYLSKYPKLQVIALEPNPENYDMARQNLEPYGDRVVLLKKGLYSSEESQKFSGSETFASVAASGFEIDCTTVPALLKQFSITHLDLLKMDIEGAEEAVFSAKPEVWLGSVGLLIIEFHGKRIEFKISKILKDNRFSMKKYRSLWYCFGSDSSSLISQMEQPFIR